VRDIQEEARIVRELTRDESGSDPFASAVRATRMPMIITDPRLPDNPIVFVNDAFGKLTGYDRNEIMGRNCRFLQGQNTDMDDVGRVRDAVAARKSIELDLLNYKKDGTHFWNRLLVSPYLTIVVICSTFSPRNTM
jgi:PAS domain S-box-containing protein